MASTPTPRRVLRLRDRFLDCLQALGPARAEEWDEALAARGPRPNGAAADSRTPISSNAGVHFAPANRRF